MATNEESELEHLKCGNNRIKFELKYIKIK